MSAPRSLIAITALALAAGACGLVDGEGADSGSLPPATPVPTISGVGVLPDSVSGNRQPIIRVSRPINEDGRTADLIGESSEGNRILLIGDSILAGASSRYGGNLCQELVPLGWETQVEAEPGRFVEFGNKVLDEVLDPSPEPGDDVWDAAVVFLGSNYRGDPVAYEAELNDILFRLAPRPTLLFTVTEFRPDWAEVNDVVMKLGAEYENVTVIDWEEIAQYPGVISSDGLHPTDAGRQVLADTIAVALGPGILGEGECLRSVFRDSSAINGGGSSSSSSSRSSSSSSSGSSSSSSGSSSGRTTTPPITSANNNPGETTAPTVPSTDPPQTSPPSTDPPQTSPPSTDPPQTSPPSTAPPQTAPPQTAPPQTSPPPTAAPTTAAPAEVASP
jgi:uncharacterized membrane protein YgcG